MFANIDIWTIIGIVLVVLGTFVGSWALIRGKVSKTLTEIGELASTLGKALEDNKISSAEQEALKKEFAELKEAIKELFKKKNIPG
jgi:regulator of replication initiation timing